LIGGILVSLRNNAFKQGYLKHESVKSLIDALYSTICTELDRTGISPSNLEILKRAFAFIKSNTSLTDEMEGKEFTERLISDIDRQINSFIQTHKYFDALSQFYIEFLRYANADKGLGIVLTPPHVTDLFTELSDINKDSVVFDNCCGTGGFLVAAMRKMIQETKGDKNKEKKIKEEQIIGIEYQPHIYALLISNMIVHQDGKTSMYLGDCFKDSKKVQQKYSPSIGLLNPPYKTKGTPIEELEFVLDNLDTLKEGGKCVAIVPLSCVTETTGMAKELKHRILKQHTLEAVMSMPENLFHGQTNVVTCILVITAHKPHPTGKKAWFGYWRADGFVLVKNRGRIDKNHTWESIKSQWVNAYRNREMIDGFSLSKEVTAKDEWCVEAYMETDYSKITQEEFVEAVQDYYSPKKDAVTNNSVNLNINMWQSFSYSDLFLPPQRGTLDNIQGVKNRREGLPVVSATTRNNGVIGYSEKHNEEQFPANCITIATTGQGSVGFPTFQGRPFIATTNVTVLIPKFECDKYIGLFICTVIKKDRYKYSWGRIINDTRLGTAKIKLPADNNGNPDWQLMEDYIKSLPYSSNL
jgi:type I restriction-modification system DNA methylase subunit